MSKITELARAAGRLLSLESSRGVADGIATLDEDGILTEAQRPPGGGADLSAVESIAFAVGEGPADVGLQADPVNSGSGSVGVYPQEGATGTYVALYDDHMSPAGEMTEPNATTVYMRARNGICGVTAGTLDSAAAVSLVVQSDDFTDDTPFAGHVIIRKDGGSTGGGVPALSVQGVLDVYYDGRVVLQTPGAGIKFTSPDGLTTKTLSIDDAGDPVWT